jgi:TonB-dependent starch-binding outer membrane protein SusC
MNKKFKDGGYHQLAKISRIMLIVTLMLILGNNCLLAALDYSQSSKSENLQQAQGKKITGKVTDQTGAPVPGASVVVKGTTVGTAADNNGNFSLTVPNDAKILVVSFLGMKAQEVPIGNEVTFNVTLSEERVGLSEYVVIGYGSVRRTDATGSISDIGSRDFNKGIQTSPDLLLNGHIAGVQVTTVNGQPGANTNVRIRGVNSISASSEPLYVIDGVPIDNSRTSTSVGGDAALSNTTLNPLSMLSSSDIESMTVLKDASATAIYGSRGANGVIIITTKGGKEGATSVSYSGSVGISSVSKKIDVLSADQYRKFVPNSATGVSTNWQDAIFRTAYSQDHNVTFGSGNNNTSYRASISASQQDGIILATGLDRYIARLNVTHKMFDERLILNMNVNNTNYKFNNFLETQTEGADGGVINNALKADPTQPVYNADGTFHEFSALSVRNPVALAKQITDVTKGDRTIISTDATFFFIPKILSFKTNLAYDVDNAIRKAYQPIASAPAKSINGRALVENNKYSNRLIETYLTYNNTFNQKHALNVVGGYSWQEFDTYNQSILATGFVNDNLRADNIGGGTSQVAQNNHEINRLISFYGRANYTYNDRYLFTFTLRDDGSSRFGSHNRWALFPSGAIAWKVKEEGFLKDNDAINDLKLRVGYGVTGNQDIGNFRYSQTYAITSNAGTYFGGTFFAPYNVTVIANPNLKWERTAQFNVGVDFAVHDNKLKGSIDLYSKKTTNLLLAIDAIQPAVSSTYLDNIGAMTNKGVELSLDASVMSKTDFSWNANFNISYNKNKITELYNNKDINYGTVSGAGASGNTQILRVGESFGSFYGQVFKGIVSGKETFDPTGNKILGKALPDVIMGFTNNLRWKSWDLSIVLRSSLGAKVYNNTRAEMSQGTRLPGQNTNIEGATFHAAGGGGIVYPSSRWVEKASFLRLDNLTLGYNFKTLPTVIKSARLTFTAQNLFVISGYKGYDPEVNNIAGSSGVRSIGIDYATYPHARTFLLGLNINF